MYFTQNCYYCRNNQSYKSVNNVIYTKNGETLVYYPTAKTESRYTIESGTETIDVMAFYNCASIETVEIPDSIKAIGMNAFYKCSKLSTIKIKAITPPTVTDGSFTPATSITNFKIQVPVLYGDIYKQSWRTSTYPTYIEEVDKYEVGYTILDSDNNTLVAVIFKVNEDGSALGVGAKNSNETTYRWCLNTASGYNTKIDSIVCTPSSIGTSGEMNTATFEGDTDGSDNWRAINSTNISEYPAFEYMNNYATTANIQNESYKTGWYIPTVAEVVDIFKNIKTINDTIYNLNYESKLSTIQEDQMYWTSSQSSSDASKAYGAYLGSSYGKYFDSFKDSYGYVLVIRKFTKEELAAINN